MSRLTHLLCSACLRANAYLTMCLKTCAGHGTFLDGCREAACKGQDWARPGQAFLTGHLSGAALQHSPVSCGESDRSGVNCRQAVVLSATSDGARVEVLPGLLGHVPTAELDITHYPDLNGFKPGHVISVKVTEVSLPALRFSLHGFP